MRINILQKTNFCWKMKAMIQEPKYQGTKGKKLPKLQKTSVFNSSANKISLLRFYFQKKKYIKINQKQNLYKKQYQLSEDKSTKPHSIMSDSIIAASKSFENSSRNVLNSEVWNSHSDLHQSQTKHLSFHSYYQQLNPKSNGQSRIDIRRCSFISYKRQKIQNQYQILQKIGQGAFGNVYRCRHKVNKSIRSVKIIKPNILSYKNHKSHLKQEIEILKKLDHPSIIKLFQIFQYQKIIHLVCEYCSGVTLKSYISQKFKFSHEMKKNIILKIFQGVSYMHSMGIVHRDLKPQNILFVNKITENSTIQSIDIKIIDFGLSKQLKERQFRDWAKIGSLPYMPPQVFRGVYSTKADSWSCGVIMHILFLGYNPFLDSQDYLILNKIENYKLQQNTKWQQLQKSLKYILSSLLNVNFILRGQIQAILINPFFQINVSYTRNKKGTSQLFSQKQINAKNLINFLKYYIVFNKISQAKSKYYGECFKQFDTNKNGVISYPQLKKILLDVQQQINQKSIQHIFDKINLDNSGKIKYGQFQCALENSHSLFTIQNINQIFDKIDIAKDGFIDFYEFKHFMADVAKKDEQKVKNLINDILEAEQDRLNRSQFLWYIINEVFL